MTTTDVATQHTRRQRVATALKGALAYASGVARRRGNEATQAAGAVATLAGVYTWIGLSATLIIGGISALVFGTLREGGRV